MLNNIITDTDEFLSSGSEFGWKVSLTWCKNWLNFPGHIQSTRTCMRYTDSSAHDLDGKLGRIILCGVAWARFYCRYLSLFVHLMLEFTLKLSRIYQFSVEIQRFWAWFMSIKGPHNVVYLPRRVVNKFVYLLCVHTLMIMSNCRQKAPFWKT